MRSSTFPRFVYIAIVLAGLLSLFSIWKRYQVEEENRAVSVTIEYETVEAMAAAQGVPVTQALNDLKAQGLNGLVLSEETIGQLISQGDAAIVSVPGTSGASVGTALKFNDPSSEARVEMGLRIRFGPLANRIDIRGDTMMMPPVSADLIRSTAIGLNPGQANVARSLQLLVIARCGNPSGATSKAVQATLEWAHQLGATIFLPQGDEVLGRRDSLLEATVPTLRALGMLYATPEFAKIAGDPEVVEAAPDIVVRLHTAQTAELDKLTPIDAVERFAKAARERNMRVLMIRPLSQAAPSPQADLDEFVRDITKEVEKHGQTIGPPHPFHEPGLPSPFFAVLGLAIAPVVWWSVARFVASPAWMIAGAALLVVLALLCGLGPMPHLMRLAQEAMALLGAMAFPIVGFYVLDEVLRSPRGGEISRILCGFAAVSVVSLVGGFCVAGVLNGLAFYVKAAEFQAVKLAVFLPIAVVGVHYFVSLSDWKGTLRSPITWGASALGLCLGLALALMLERTGNDTGVGPSGGEMVFRNLLDRFLYVRPRTKEFLIGHPILVIAIGMLSRYQPWRRSTEERDQNRMNGWTILALTLGAIGQTSVVNTFCHLHVPVLLSFSRAIEGLVLGCIIGVGLWVVLDRALPGTEA